jgi:hypothetical protein
MLHVPGAHRDSPHCACECRLPDDCWPRFAARGGREDSIDGIVIAAAAAAMSPPPPPESPEATPLPCSRPRSDRVLLFRLLLLLPSIVSLRRLPNKRPGTGIRTRRLSSQSSSSSSSSGPSPPRPTSLKGGSVATSDGDAKLSSDRTCQGEKSKVPKVRKTRKVKLGSTESTDPTNNTY